MSVCWRYIATCIHWEYSRRHWWRCSSCETSTPWEASLPSSVRKVSWTPRHRTRTYWWKAATHAQTRDVIRVNLQFTSDFGLPCLIPSFLCSSCDTRWLTVSNDLKQDAHAQLLNKLTNYLPTSLTFDETEGRSVVLVGVCTAWDLELTSEVGNLQINSLTKRGGQM